MKHLLALILFAVIFQSCKPFLNRKGNTLQANIQDDFIGYTDKTSYFEGDSLTLYLSSTNEITTNNFEILDLRGKIVHQFPLKITHQKINSVKPYEKGYGFKPTKKIKIPNISSGVYLIGGKIPIVIKSRKKTDILIVYPSNTENAYSNSGGKSMYNGNSSDKKATEIASFHRPIPYSKYAAGFLQWSSTLPKKYSIGYICDKDLDNYQLLENAQLIIIIGHNEYWTLKARENFDKFINNGKNALILSGNTMWWQVRYQKNQMLCYRKIETDPIVSPALKTILWTDTTLHYPILPSIGADFSLGGYGLKKDIGWNGYKITNAPDYIFAKTKIKEGDTIALPTDEYDGAPLIFNSDSTQVEIDNSLNYCRYELIGYDFASRNKHSNGTWILLQKTDSSGIVINTASTNWCTKETFNGQNNSDIKQITLNMIKYLLKEEN